MRACLKVGGMNDGGQAGGLNGLKKGDMLVPMLEKVRNLPIKPCLVAWSLETRETHRAYVILRLVVLFLLLVSFK